jgi:hypothetical protein
MERFKKFPATVLLLLFLMTTICAITLWLGLPIFYASSDHQDAATIPAIQPVAEVKQAIPEKRPESMLEDRTPNHSSLTTDAIWKDLLAGFKSGKKAQIDLENALIERLQTEPDSAIYMELLSLFRQGSLDSSSQQVLVSILGEVGNYQSAETLMKLVNEALLVKPDVKLAAFEAINKFSPELWHEHPNTELAPVFEAAWQTENAEFWLSIANVMASIGTPATLDIFIETLNNNTNPERVKIVKEAMTNLVNPALIPKLADLLENPATENVQLASGDALANMGKGGFAIIKLVPASGCQ